MGNALDMFRAQREAADSLHARIADLSTLLGQMHRQVEGLALNGELRQMLREEQAWLREAQDAVRQVRVWREREMQRFWPGVLRRWCLAGLLTLATATAAGVGYAWASKPYAEELAALRSRVELADTLAQRLLTMTPAERRQFDALMKANRGTR